MEKTNFQNNSTDFYEKIENAFKTENFFNKFFYKNTFILGLSIFSFFIIISFWCNYQAVLISIVGLIALVAVYHLLKFIKISQSLFDFLIFLVFTAFIITYLLINSKPYYIFLILIVPILFYSSLSNIYSTIYSILFILIFESFYFFTNFFENNQETQIIVISTIIYFLLMFFLMYLKKTILNYFSFLNSFIEKEQINLNVNIHIIEFALHQLRTAMNNLVVYQEFNNTSSSIIELERYKKQTMEIMQSTLTLIENIMRKNQIQNNKVMNSAFLSKFASYFELMYPNLFFKNIKEFEFVFKNAEKEKNFYKIIIILIEIIKNVSKNKKSRIDAQIFEKQEYLILSFNIQNIVKEDFYVEENKLYFELLKEYLLNIVASYSIKNDNLNNVVFEVVFEKNMIKEKDSEINIYAQEIEDKEGMKLLIADDDEINQKILLIGFQKYFEQIDVVQNGAEVLQILSQKNYDLLLMDLQMPNINGLEAIKKIRELEKSSNNHLIAIGISANTLAYSKDELKNFGFDDFFVKPFKIKDIYNSFLTLKN